MEGAHLGADQAFDMSAIMWSSSRPPLDFHACILASSNKGAAAKLRAIVNMQRCREPRDRLGLVDVSFLQPRRFIEDRMKQA
jgi:hypothetical protein